MSPPAVSVSVPLPAGFTVMWTADDEATAPVDEGLLDGEQRAWLTDLRNRSARAPGMVLCAVHVELWRDEPVTASLIVQTQPLDEAALGPDGLHEWALDRTSTAGQVSQLQLADSRAVRTVDVVTIASQSDPVPGAAGVVEVHLPQAAPGLLVSLALTTQHVALLGAYAAVVTEIAQGVGVDVDGSVAPSD